MSSEQDSDHYKERSGSDNTNGMMDANGMENGQHHEHEKFASASAALSHSLPPDSPDNPQNWPLYCRVLTSFQAWAYAFTV